MHGTQDVNAPLSASMRIAEALIRENKPFETLIMPSDGHSLGSAARRCYMDDVHRFFARTLGGPLERPSGSNAERIDLEEAQMK